MKKFWAAWDKGEVKKVNVPAHKYQKVELVGTCLAVGRFRKVERHTIQDSWAWNWDRK